MFILDNSPLSGVSLANIFCQFVACLHNSLTLSFDEWSVFRFFVCLFPCECSVVPTFVEKTAVALLYCFCSFVKDNLLVFMEVYF